jgi:copper homeostasis protein (lipoprotein)
VKIVTTVLLLSFAWLDQAMAETDQDSIELQGMFSYTASAAQFRDCHTGKSFPVAKVGPYTRLEQAYLDSGIEPGNELMVAIRGRYLARPTGDENASEVVMLVVDAFEKAMDSGDCTSAGTAQLRGTYWKLLEIEGKSITTPQDRKDVHMLLAGDGSAVQGFAGCNSFFGQYSSSGEALTFSGLGSTMMACPEGMDTEVAFLQVLGETSRAVIDGKYLQLYVEDRLLARLEAIPRQ